MKTSEDVDLIKGTFGPEEAREIVLAFLSSNISFHSLRNLSSQERFGKPDEISEQKLKYLKEARKNAEVFLSDAIAQRRRVAIDSVLRMELK